MKTEHTAGTQKTLSEFAKEVHQNAVDHGWWIPEPDIEQILTMIHSELSEAVDAYRKSEGDDRIAEELADAVIRMFDYFGKTGCSEGAESEIKEAILESERRHFRTRQENSLIVTVHFCHVMLVNSFWHCDKRYITVAIIAIFTYCNANGIDLAAAIKKKHEYNKTRPYRHGGKLC